MKGNVNAKVLKDWIECTRALLEIGICVSVLQDGIEVIQESME